MESLRVTESLKLATTAVNLGLMGCKAIGSEMVVVWEDS